MDLLDWFVLKDSSKHLEGTSNPTYASVWPPDEHGTGKIWWVKNKQGYPWDCMIYTKGKIQLWATESDERSWTDPTIYKAFQTPVVMAPRNISHGMPTEQVVTKKPAPTEEEPNPVDLTNVVYYEEGNIVKVAPLGGIRTQVVGPVPIDWGGDVGAQPTISIYYQWGFDGHLYPKRETFYLVEGIGLVRWDTADMDTVHGVYVLKQFSVFNKIVDGNVAPVTSK